MEDVGEIEPRMSISPLSSEQLFLTKVFFTYFLFNVSAHNFIGKKAACKVMLKLNAEKSKGCINVTVYHKIMDYIGSLYLTVELKKSKAKQ